MKNTINTAFLILWGEAQCLQSTIDHNKKAESGLFKMWNSLICQLLNCVTEQTFMPLNKNSITGCKQCFSPFIGFLPAYLHMQGPLSPDVKSLKWIFITFLLLPWLLSYAGIKTTSLPFSAPPPHPQPERQQAVGEKSKCINLTWLDNSTAQPKLKILYEKLWNGRKGPCMNIFCAHLKMDLYVEAGASRSRLWASHC